jgi:hypothetical protein
MYETEDSIVDFEKVKRSTGKMKLPDDDIKAKINVFNKSEVDRKERLVNVESSLNLYNKYKDMPSASRAYSDIRDYIKTFMDNALVTSTKTGLGQRLDPNLANMTVKPAAMRRIAATLREGGSKERADLLERVADGINAIDPLTDDITLKEKNKARQTLINTIPKLNKGGLVSRRG